MTFPERHRVRRPAFTVLEITVVLCTVLLLISLLLPAIQQAREQARRQQCQQNMAQIGIALRTYHDAHRCLPSGVVNPLGPVVSRSHDVTIFAEAGDLAAGDYGYGGFGGGGGGLSDMNYGSGDGGDGSMAPDQLSDESVTEKAAREKAEQKFEEIRSEYLVSWIAQILPQLDRQTTYRQIDFQTPQLSFVSKAEKKGWQERYQSWTTVGGGGIPWFPEPQLADIRFLHCPSRISLGFGNGLLATHYSGCYASQAVPIDINNDGLLYLNSSESLEDVPDGASSTILVGESADGVFRSFYYGDHSSLRATVQVALDSNLDRFQDYSQRGALEELVQDFTKDPMSMGFSSNHNLITQFLFADGAVQSISNMIDAQVLSKLGSRNDGSVLSADRF